MKSRRRRQITEFQLHWDMQILAMGAIHQLSPRLLYLSSWCSWWQCLPLHTFGKYGVACRRVRSCQSAPSPASRSRPTTTPARIRTAAPRIRRGRRPQGGPHAQPSPRSRPCSGQQRRPPTQRRRRRRASRRRRRAPGYQQQAGTMQGGRAVEPTDRPTLVTIRSRVEPASARFHPRRGRSPELPPQWDTYLRLRLLRTCAGPGIRASPAPSRRLRQLLSPGLSPTCARPTLSRPSLTTQDTVQQRFPRCEGHQKARCRLRSRCQRKG